MKLTKNQYPLTLSVIADKPEMAKKIMLKENPHKGVFIGLCKLEGSFLCDSPGEVYSSLSIGEKLCITPDASSKHTYPPLMVTLADGTLLGKLPFGNSVIPNMLLSRGISVWCHAEAKVFGAGMLEIAVSVYCEDY